MSKHTKGPWKAVPTSIDDPAFTLDIVAPQSPPHLESVGSCPTVATLWFRSDSEEAAANARLIAAAPELLAALQQSVASFDKDMSELVIAKLRAVEVIAAATRGS